MYSLPCPPVLVAPQLFDDDEQALAALTPASVWHRAGALPVVVTSVHGHDHVRAGSVKARDEGSLAFSSLLARTSGASWLAVGQAGELDSNFHSGTPFKKALALLCQERRPVLVLDVHTAHAGRPFDVDLGSLDGQSWQDLCGEEAALLGLLRQQGFYATNNAVFKAYGAGPEAQTVTAFAHKNLGVPAVQLEISSALCEGQESRLSYHLRAKLLNVLAGFIQSLGR